MLTKPRLSVAEQLKITVEFDEFVLSTGALRLTTGSIKVTLKRYIDEFALLAK